jgi:hydroxyacylglutathione hydrolase
MKKKELSKKASSCWICRAKLKTDSLICKKCQNKLLSLAWWQLAIILVALLFLVGSCMNFIGFYRAKGQMSIMPSAKIYKNLSIVQGKIANFYIYSDRKNMICIDSGDDPVRSQKDLEKINIDPAKIDAVFLTHTDFDHTAGLTLFPQAQVYLLTTEEQMINGRKARKAFFWHNKISSPYKLINDGGMVMVGNIKVEAIGTPGHTPGSASYLVDNKYLFTGDTLALRNGKVGLFFKVFNMDDEQQSLSISKLAGLRNITLLGTAHTGYTTDFAKAVKDWQ